VSTVIRQQHHAYVEFEVEVGEPEPIPEDYRGFDNRTHYQPTRKLRLTARENDVDTLLVKMLAHEDTRLSELSCTSGCVACATGQASPF
jgi:hypothetical protein